MIPNDSAEIVNLEHVLPENPDQNWPEFDPSIQPVYYTRLGNMVLLKSSENSSIGNKGFTEKRKTLAGSSNTKSFSSFHLRSLVPTVFLGYEKMSSCRTPYQVRGMLDPASSELSPPLERSPGHAFGRYAI